MSSDDHQSQPELWLRELLEELRSEEVDAGFRQLDREVRLPVVLAHPGLDALLAATDRLGRELAVSPGLIRALDRLQARFERGA